MGDLFFSLSSRLSTDKVTPRDSLSECLAANPPYSQKKSSNREKLDGALTDISNHSFNPIIILSNKAGHLLFYISCLFAIKRLIFFFVLNERQRCQSRFMHQEKRSNYLPPFSFPAHHRPRFMLTPAFFFFFFYVFLCFPCSWLCQDPSRSQQHCCDLLGSQGIPGGDRCWRGVMGMSPWTLWGVRGCKRSPGVRTRS